MDLLKFAVTVDLLNLNFSCLMWELLDHNDHKRINLINNIIIQREVIIESKKRRELLVGEGGTPLSAKKNALNH